MRKTRIDKGSDRLNTRTKYFLYALFSLLSWYSLGYTNWPVEIKTVYKESKVSCIEEIVCRPSPPNIEYVFAPCTTWAK